MLNSDSGLVADVRRWRRIRVPATRLCCATKERHGLQICIATPEHTHTREQPKQESTIRGRNLHGTPSARLRISRSSTGWCGVISEICPAIGAHPAQTCFQVYGIDESYIACGPVWSPQFSRRMTLMHVDPFDRPSSLPVGVKLINDHWSASISILLDVHAIPRCFV
jgi:hypothetical protein